MPFYRFDLDVPAEASVVEQRLRTAIGNREDRWIDGPAGAVFYGRIENGEFRIRRNAGSFRNGYLPRIRGRLTALGETTRLKVAMWINPAVVLVALLWVAGLSWLASSGYVGHNQASLFRLVTLLVGIGLGFVSFYREARRARLLLTWIATDVSERSRQAQWQWSQNTPLPRGLRFLGAALVALAFLSTVTILLRQRLQLSQCPAFRQTVALASSSANVRKILGDGIKVDGWARGIAQSEDRFGYALLSIPIRGAKGNGIVHAVANRVRGEWRLERVAFWGRGGKRIDLTPAVRRETFQYPASGATYLIPFDKKAAEQVAELPGYFAARLGLKTILLPVMALPEGAVDATSKQVIAERAADFMETTARRLDDDPDAVFLGITSQDMNIQSSGWHYAINYRTGNSSVVSTARVSRIPMGAKGNPEVFPERVRKLVTKNMVLLRFPISLSADRTSVLARSTYGQSDLDIMSEEILGEGGKWRPAAGSAPCISIMSGPQGKQAWSDNCYDTPPNDDRFETFDHYTWSNSLVISRADFPFAGDRRLAFIRKHWTKDDKSRAFGLGGNDSFDIFLVGDSRAFSWIDLIHEGGQHTSFRRTSLGTSYRNAKLEAAGEASDQFGLSTLQWNGNGWDLNTADGWKYRFPASGPGRSNQLDGVMEIASPLAKARTMRTASGMPTRIDGLAGATIDFESDEQHRITKARHSSGHAIGYRYGADGRLSAMNDSQYGEERYEYDEAGRLTTVRDAKGVPQLSIRYGYSGEITAETLADGRTLRYQTTFGVTRELESVVLRDDRGFQTKWTAGDEDYYYEDLPIYVGRGNHARP